MSNSNRNNLKKENLLSSWKEIAAYLDCDIRTCHRWEKEYGLPIHRLSESSKARVFTTKEELDEWLRTKENDKEGYDRERFRFGPKMRSGTLSILVSLIVIVAVCFVLLKPFQSNRPADFKIEGSVLVVLNEKGKELWRFDTELEKLVDEKTYRLYFQFKHDRGDRARYLPHLIIKDIDSDNSPEVLFSTQTQGEFGEGELYCFDHKGQPLWTFKAGREIKFGSKVYSPDFRIKGFDVVDLDNDGLLEIVVVSRHHDYFPNQVVVLDHRKNLKGEYWNSGYILDYAFVDFDEDGTKELVFSGTNNEYQTGCLVVFDSSDMKGASPQFKSTFKCEQLKKGSEKYYILLPRIEWALGESILESVSRFDVLQNARISVLTHFSSLYYEFDFELKLVDIRTSHAFESIYNEAKKEGIVDFEVDAFIQELSEKVLYYNGRDWLPELNRVEK